MIDRRFLNFVLIMIYFFQWRGFFLGDPVRHNTTRPARAVTPAAPHQSVWVGSPVVGVSSGVSSSWSALSGVGVAVGLGEGVALALGAGVTVGPGELLESGVGESPGPGLTVGVSLGPGLADGVPLGPGVGVGD